MNANFGLISALKSFILFARDHKGVKRPIIFSFQYHLAFLYLVFQRSNSTNFFMFYGFVLQSVKGVSKKVPTFKSWLVRYQLSYFGEDLFCLVISPVVGSGQADDRSISLTFQVKIFLCHFVWLYLLLCPRTFILFSFARNKRKRNKTVNGDEIPFVRWFS